MRLCIICFGMGMKLKIYFEYLIEVPETSQPCTNMRSHWTITVHGGGAQQIQISFFKLTVFVISTIVLSLASVVIPELVNFTQQRNTVLLHSQIL